MGVVQSITAAASRLVAKKGSRKATSNTSSAALAWDFYETVPEIGTFADWISNSMSGATLFAGRRLPDGLVERDDSGRAAELVSAMAGGMDGQSTMLSEFGTQLAVAGEAWLVIIPDPESDTYNNDRWVVLSTEEVKQQRGKISATVDGEQIEIQEVDPDAASTTDEPVAIRIWKPSPRRHHEATSPVIRSLVVLEELRLLNAAVAAIAKSRITGRGVLLVPAGTRFPAAPGQTAEEDSLLDTFIEVASTAIREPDSAAATVPIVLEVPGDLISGVKWLQFTSDFDEMALRLRDEAVRRFATGADVPAEVLLGLGDASHWGAWALTAEALRMGAEPRLALVCNGLTTEWLRPLLEAEGVPDAADWVVWYDTSGLRSSSNKSASALEAFDKGLISDAAARRELGFTEADKPGAADGGGTDGDNTAPRRNERRELPVAETQAPPASPGVQDAQALAASAVLDSFTGGTSAALTEALDGLVWSALAVASRKLVQTPLCPRGERVAAREYADRAEVHVHHRVPLDAVSGYRLLDGAWLRVPEIAERYGLDSVRLAAALDEYTTTLITSGQPHHRDNVVRLATRVRIEAA